MPSLAELQTAFADALLGDGADADVSVQAWVKAGSLAPAQRVQVYRNAVRVRLKDALADLYPVLRRLIGAACFDGVASAFLKTHPPRVGYLHPFGAQMPQLCAQLPILAGLPYLPDVARLEWAWQQAFHATDAPPLTVQDFASAADGQPDALRLRLHDSATVLRSAYPVGRIFEANQPDYRGDDVVSLDQGGESLLIVRRGMKVCVERLSPGEYALLAALDQDAPLGEALHTALCTQPDCAVGDTLAKHVAGGTFARHTPNQAPIHRSSP